MKPTRKLSSLLFAAILLLFVVPQFLQAYLVFNQLNQAYTPSISGPKSESGTIPDDDIEPNIVNGATSLLSSVSKFQMLLSYVESKAPMVDFELLRVQIDSVILTLESSKREYKAISRKIEFLPQNLAMIQRLVNFDYQSFSERRKPNEVIYQSVTEFLQDGDTNGLLNQGLRNVEEVLSYLYEIKKAIDGKEIPFTLIYRANDKFYYTVLFGQYPAEVMNEILKE